MATESVIVAVMLNNIRQIKIYNLMWLDSCNSTS